jgi:myosin heavy subunit
METLSNELRELGDESTLPLAKKVFSCTSAENQPALRSSIRGISVGSQFRTSLQNLVANLDLTQPHYIRCIKPNLTKSPSSFMAGEVLKQLRYSGMIEAIRIRREGYAMREEHESFYNRFSVLLTSKELESGDASGVAGIEQLVKVLSKRLNVTDADWQIGHSKIFLRRELSDKLERLTKLRVYSASRVLGRFAKRITFSRLSRFLVAWVRFRIRMRKHYRESRAASRLAAWVHRVYDQRRFRSFRKAVILVQAEQRRKTATQRARKIRDPYVDMSFRDCKRLLESNQERLEEAVKEKKFRQAADLESKM